MKNSSPYCFSLLPRLRAAAPVVSNVCAPHGAGTQLFDGYPEITNQAAAMQPATPPTVLGEFQAPYSSAREPFRAADPASEVKK